MSTSPAAEPLGVDAFLAQPQPAPDAVIPYGPAPVQAVDLYLPEGAGPHPTVILIHGGCWSSDIPGREHVRAVAGDLRRRGLAVWSIGYRRVEEPGGGYPGTFQDAGAAIDLLRAEGPKRGLRTDGLVAVGHSAGGHLAQWAAARAQLPAWSPLKTAAPLPIAAVVSVGGLGDLKQFPEAIEARCGAGVVGKLTAAPSAERPDVYVETSPAQMTPGPAAEVLVFGELDTLSTPAINHALVQSRAAQGREVKAVEARGAGHFDLMAPGRAGWEAVAREVLRLAR
ncbi:MAG: alpha/beta hydrolase [Caulobacteraceae bacterium]|nr:alpha/beta hydrolase [Caulobacteraceae bacterium]